MGIKPHRTLVNWLSGKFTPRMWTILEFAQETRVKGKSDHVLNLSALLDLSVGVNRPSHSLQLPTSIRLPLPSINHRFLSTIMATNPAEGRREDAIAKERDKLRQEFERQKQNLINETEKARPSSNRFVGQNDSMEDHLKNQTVGLVRLEEFQQKRRELEEAKAREAARTNDLK